MEKYIIYKAENLLTEETYIGATTLSIKSRMDDHIRKSISGAGHYFHEAISTYGEEFFKWEQIDTAESLNELAKKERKYILEYNSKENGYNRDSGGGFKKSVYKYDIIDGSLMETFDSLESAAYSIGADKKQISKACLSVNKVFGGYFWSYDYLVPFVPDKDIRKKEIYQYTLEGNLLASYVSISEASRQTNCNHSSIAKVCRGERNHAGGFLWRFS